MSLEGTLAPHRPSMYPVVFSQSRLIQGMKAADHLGSHTVRVQFSVKLKEQQIEAQEAESHSGSQKIGRAAGKNVGEKTRKLEGTLAVPFH